MPNGVPRITLTVAVADLTYQADVTAKPLRRCITAIQAAGPDGVVVVLQGKLVGRPVIDASISAGRGTEADRAVGATGARNQALSTP